MPRPEFFAFGRGDAVSFISLSHVVRYLRTTSGAKAELSNGEVAEIPAEFVEELERLLTESSQRATVYLH